jgi:hypothetical protein
MKAIVLISLFFSFIVVPGFFIKKLIPWLRGFVYGDSEIIKSETKNYRPNSFLSRLAGFLERTFFIIVIFYDGANAASAMITWLFLKMATGWNLLSNNEPTHRKLAFCSLHAGLISMLCALVGGLIIGRLYDIDF